MDNHPYITVYRNRAWSSSESGPTLLGPGRTILTRGARAFLALNPTMDSLVGLGMGSAYISSLVGFLWPASGWPCFFNEPVMLLAFVLLGRFLEERARNRTGDALGALASLQPEQALLLLGDGPPRPVPVGSLRPGDRIQVLSGDRLPVDGVVLEGHSHLDGSSLSGEAQPLEAAPGAELSAGRLNLEATLVLQARLERAAGPGRSQPRVQGRWPAGQEAAYLRPAVGETQ